MRPGLLQGWVRLLRRRWRAGSLLFVLVGGAGTALVLLSRPVYRAEARLRLGEPPPMSGVSPTAGFFGLLRLGGDPFSNDLELLTSRTVAEGVVDDAVLHVRLDAPRHWHRDSLFAFLEAGRATSRRTWEIAWEGDAVVVTARDSVPLRVRPGEEARFGDVRAVLLPWREGMPERIRLKTVPHAQAARELGGRLEVVRTRRDAVVARIRYQSDDPRLTYDVVASAVARFMALRTMLSQRESGETVDSLRSVAEKTKLELAAAEEALEDHQRRTGLIMPEPQLEANLERHVAILTRLETARIELRALEEALSKSRLAADDAASSWAALFAYPPFLANETVGGQLRSLTELETRRRELVRYRTENNPELRSVLDQIAHLDRSLRTMAEDFAAALRAEVEALDAQVQSDRAALAVLPTATIELGRRQRELRIASEMMVVTEQRLRQEELRQALTFANVQVIDPPALRDRPVWPRRKLGPLIALMIGGMTALLGMVVVDRADRRVRTAGHVGAVLGVPAFAGIVANGARPRIARADLAALARRVAGDGATAVSNGAANGARTTVGRLGLVDVGGGRAAALAADAILASVAGESGDGSAENLRVDLLPPAATFGAAAAAAAARIPVFVVVEVGRTTDTSLVHAATLLREAGADVAGAVLVCRGERQAEEVWE